MPLKLNRDIVVRLFLWHLLLSQQHDISHWTEKLFENKAVMHFIMEWPHR